MRRYTWPILAACVILGGCGGAGPVAATPDAGALAGTLTVFAAASLTESFNALALEFTAEHPRVTVTPSYAGSGALVAQIANGAAADVFASADEANMQKLVEAKLSAAEPAVFAQNTLRIVVQAGNPKAIAQLSDLARPGLIVVLGAPSVPVGAYATQALDSAGVHVAPQSLETDTKQVVAKVALGEADAGIVYTTDVAAGGARVQGVDIPERYNVVARYPIAVVKGARHEAEARAFVEFVRSARGRQILASFGFLPP